MAESIKRERGIAVLESAALVTILLSMLLAGWGAVDLFQQATFLEEAVENGFYNGVAPAYSRGGGLHGDDLEVNHVALATFMNARIGSIVQVIEKNGTKQDSYLVQGAIVELVWSEGSDPRVERLTSLSPRGSLAVNGDVERQIDFAGLTHQFIARLERSNPDGRGFIRSSPWRNAEGNLPALTSRFIVTGISAVMKPSNGLGELLLKGAGREPFIVRTTFNTLRKDL